MKIFLPAILFCSLPLCVAAQFRFHDVDGKSLEILDGDKPVMTYNYGTMLKEGVPADRARCCYVHPVYAPNGVLVTDDFPKDHYHHRGINWMWPVVTVDGKDYDLWTIKGIHARFGRWLERKANTKGATIGVENSWYVEETPVVREQVTMTVHPAAGNSRDVHFVLKLRALKEGVSIAGTKEGNKGYGGFNIRFAPRTATTIQTPNSQDARDSDLKPEPWAQLTGDYQGGTASTRITIDPSNPGFPNGWCLRRYGFLGVDYPGLTSVVLPTRKDIVLRYRVTLTGK